MNVYENLVVWLLYFWLAPKTQKTSTACCRQACTPILTFTDVQQVYFPNKIPLFKCPEKKRILTKENSIKYLLVCSLDPLPLITILFALTPFRFSFYILRWQHHILVSTVLRWPMLYKYNETANEKKITPYNYSPLGKKLKYEVTYSWAK